MATFTMELRTMMKLTDDIGLNEYPIFEEPYRELLNKKITDHFLLREIGAETPDMFRLYMRRKMNEIMPEYNQFYLSERMKIDPLKTLDIRSMSEQESTGTTQASGTSTTESESGSKARSITSSTPQMELANYGDYADGASDSIGQTTNTGTGVEESDTTNTGTGTVTAEQSGYSGNQSDMLNLYRTTFLNIDLDIINRLDREGLFMNLWSSGDEFFRREHRYGLTYPHYPLYPHF